jgi:hypothetical protein
MPDVKMKMREDRERVCELGSWEIVLRHMDERDHWVETAAGRY